MGSAHNIHPGFDLWSDSRRKDGRVVAFIVCGLIASASGLVLQMADRDANVDARSVIAAVPLNPGTLLSTIVSPAPLSTIVSPVSSAASAPDSRQGTASPSNSPQTAPLNAIPTPVTASTASTASTGEVTTGRTEQPAAASNESQKAVRSPKQHNQGRYDAAAGWGRYVHERPSLERLSRTAAFACTTRTYSISITASAGERLWL